MMYKDRLTIVWDRGDNVVKGECGMVLALTIYKARVG
jgi:hypothetical protein